MNYTREEACLAWLTYGNLPPDGLKQLLTDYPSAEAVYDSFGKTTDFMRRYGPRACTAKLAEHRGKDAMHQMLLTMQKHHMRILRLGDSDYPELLSEISDPPVILFYQGDITCLHARCITMVGSRSASPHGLASAREVAADFGASGVTVISGFAQGIDAASHEGCLEAGGRTAAILACGLDVDYPLGHEDLRRRILDTGGVLLTEYPPGMHVQRFHFAVRNRIMSGLSRATIMMECQPKSGSMLTVQHALDQGRDVYAYPGQAGTPAAAGSHLLLREGASYFAFAEDIMADLGWTKPYTFTEKKTKTAPPPPALPGMPGLTDEQQQILNALSGGESSFDQLAAATGLDAPALSGALTLLQLLGLIQAMPGKMYARV